ncbi:MAG TPA: hypothetical protein VGG14_16980 [Candidatus Sulfotelmatobacter sp.]
MTAPSSNAALSFEAWKDYLCSDCVRNEKLAAYNCLGDFILKLLYDNGIAPTVDAILNDEVGQKAV